MALIIKIKEKDQKKMEIKLVGRVLKINRSNGVSYVSFNDTEEGGLIDLSIPGGNEIKIDDLLSIEAVIQPGKGKYGQYLKVTDVASIKKTNEPGK